MIAVRKRNISSLFKVKCQWKFFKNSFISLLYTFKTPKTIGSQVNVENFIPYSYYDLNTGEYKTKNFKNLEPAYIDDVSIFVKC